MLPSYQNAVEGSDVRISDEKDVDTKERYVAQPTDKTRVMPIPIHHITAFSPDDHSSLYTSSDPPSPGHSDVSPHELSFTELPSPTHPHDLV